MLVIANRLLLECSTLEAEEPLLPDENRAFLHFIEARMGTLQQVSKYQVRYVTVYQKGLLYDEANYNPHAGMVADVV